MFRSSALRFPGKRREAVDWAGVWGLARRHHLETLVWSIAEKDGALPDEFRAQMSEENSRMIARDVRQGWCLDQIEKALEQAGIHYAPIKGAILKNDYPQTC